MSHIEDELRNRFNQQKLSNDDFESEDLWSSIFNEIHPPSEITPLPGFNKFWFIAIGITILLLGSIIGYYFSTTESSKKDSLTNDKNIIADKSIIDHSSKDNAHYVPTQNQNHISETNQTENNTNFDKNQKHEGRKENDENKEITSNAFTDSNKSKSLNTNRQNLKNNNHKSEVISNEFKSKSQEKLIHKKHDLDKSKTQNQKPNPDHFRRFDSDQNVNQNSILVDNNTIKERTFIPEKLIALDKINSLSYRLKDDQNSIVNGTFASNYIPESSENLTQFSMGLSSGLNAINFKYSSIEDADFASLLNNVNKRYIGNSYGLELSLLHKNAWVFQTGIEFHQLWSKLDYEEIMDTPTLKENQLLKVWVDGMTNDTINQLYGDTTVNVRSTRKVVHFNEFKRISIPLEIGFQKSINKFSYGLTAGIGINFTSLQSGRNIDPKMNVVNFTKEDEFVPFKSFDIGWRISPILGYQLTQKLSVNLLPKWMFSQNNKLNNSDLSLHSYQLNVNLGLRYKI